jgi:hypothetical protein
MVQTPNLPVQSLDVHVRWKIATEATRVIGMRGRAAPLVIASSMQTNTSIWVAAALAAMIRHAPVRAENAPFVVYLDPFVGHDSNSGTNDSPLLTLQAAQRVIKSAAPSVAVEVRIKPGTYYQQIVDWDYFQATNTTTFTRWPPDSLERPVFDGCPPQSAGTCPGGTFFSLNVHSGTKTNLVFNYLDVRNYTMAISFNGSRSDASKSNGSNIIYGCYFRSIGNHINAALPPAYAAVRLINSDDNHITNNHFINIENLTYPRSIHAIYISGMSDRNKVLRNNFDTSSGDPIRLRDYSNDNVISDNQFTKTGTAGGYTDWYCDKSNQDNDCTKKTAECPSWNNQFQNNKLDGDYNCNVMKEFTLFQGDVAAGCTPPAGAVRVLASGQIEISPPTCSLHPARSP